MVGTARGCGKVLEGSGFVFARHHVMTNAHVVGGVRDPTVQVGGVGRQYPTPRWCSTTGGATSRCSTCRRWTPPRSASPPPTRTPATAPSWPASRRTAASTCSAARVRARIQANGPDIYHRGNVSRDVYSLYTLVRQGNSGGPLLTPTGQVYGVVFAKSLDDDTTGYALTDERGAPGHRGRSHRGATGGHPGVCALDRLRHTAESARWAGPAGCAGSGLRTAGITAVGVRRVTRCGRRSAATGLPPSAPYVRGSAGSPTAVPGPGAPRWVLTCPPEWRCGDCVIRHGSRASSPYGASCPPRAVGNRMKTAQSVYASGIGHSGCQRHGRERWGGWFGGC